MSSALGISASLLLGLACLPTLPSFFFNPLHFSTQDVAIYPPPPNPPFNIRYSFLLLLLTSSYYSSAIRSSWTQKLWKSHGKLKLLLLLLLLLLG